MMQLHLRLGPIKIIDVHVRHVSNTVRTSESFFSCLGRAFVAGTAVGWRNVRRYVRFDETSFSLAGFRMRVCHAFVGHADINTAHEERIHSSPDVYG